VKILTAVRYFLSADQIKGFALLLVVLWVGVKLSFDGGTRTMAEIRNVPRETYTH